MKQKFAVIFDMDGVIIDSNPVITKAWKGFFEQHGIQLSEEQLKKYVFGRTTEDTLSAIFEKELEAELVKAYAGEVGVAVKQLYQDEVRAVAGIRDFVAALVKADIPIAIATSAPEENVQTALQAAGVAELFELIVNGSQVQFSKPHPEIYLNAAAKLGIAPENCLVFEDSLSGIAAGNAAGMKVIGITTTHTITELISNVDEVISDFTVIDVPHIQEFMK